MERTIKHVKYFTSAVVSGVSAVCSGVVATGTTSGPGPESFIFLGSYLSPL